MTITFAGELWHWRGPAPFYFVSLSPEACEQVRMVAALVTYGWGMIPVTARIGGTEWTTSLWLKDGGYVLPVKAAVRKSEGLEEGTLTAARIKLGA